MPTHTIEWSPQPHPAVADRDAAVIEIIAVADKLDRELAHA